MMWMNPRDAERPDGVTRRSSLRKRCFIIVLAVLVLAVTGIAYKAAHRNGVPVKNGQGAASVFLFRQTTRRMISTRYVVY